MGMSRDGRKFPVRLLASLLRVPDQEGPYLDARVRAGELSPRETHPKTKRSPAK